jgi:hypothetical protein
MLSALLITPPPTPALWLKSWCDSRNATPGDQIQYIHVPFEFVRKEWQRQSYPHPGPSIAFNTSFGMVGRSAITAPTHVTFPITSGGRSAPILNTAAAFTAVLPLLQGGSSLLSTGYRSTFTHRELWTCVRWKP